MAGGIVLMAILSHVIGIKQAILLMTCALIFSHSSRAYFFLPKTDWQSVKTVLLFSGPTIIIGAVIFGYLLPATVAYVMAVFLTLSFPIKAYARRNKLQTTPAILAGASTIWGILAGNVIGPGFFLAPFLLGSGMNRLTFVGTMASIVLFMNIIKLSVFGMTEHMNMNLFALGAVLGLITVPGNWVGRELLKGISDAMHRNVVDIMTLLMIVNFVYLIFVS